MIAIKDMEMPKSCALCERFEGACKYTDFGDYQTERNPNCSLVEIGTCKDCIHRDPEDKKCDCGHDIQWQLPREDDWYCADFKK